MNYLYKQARRAFFVSEDSTPSDDDLTDEVDEGFVDNSMEAPSISEDLLTVGAGAPDDEEEEDDDDEYIEVCTLHNYVNCYCI